MKNPINVIIDARMVDEHLHGIARYTYELIKIGSQSKKVKYHLLVNDLKVASKVFSEIDGVEFIEMKSKFLSLNEQMELPKVINGFKGDAIFHSPSFVGSPLINKTMTMTIHDLNHLRFPQFYTKFHKYYYNLIVKSSANKSNKILTVSNFSKEELLEWLKCDKSKVQVTYNGIDESFKPINNIEDLGRVSEKYKLPKKFVLYVGNQKPHKNVETLIKAFKYISDKELYLVINGKPNDTLNALMKEFNVTDKVKFIGFIDDKDLAPIYSLAQLFVFPSLYEGFGLPPLEAMACGCLAIASDTSSLTEIMANKQLLFDPLDDKALADKILNILNADNKEELKKWSMKRAAEFKWNETFDKTYDVYKEMINK